MNNGQEMKKLVTPKYKFLKSHFLGKMRQACYFDKCL